MIKCSIFCNGVTQLSRWNCQEYPALMLLTMICIDGLMSIASEEQEFRLLLNNSLVLYQSLMINWINQNELSYLEIKIKNIWLISKILLVRCRSWNQMLVWYWQNFVLSFMYLTLWRNTELHLIFWRTFGRVFKTFCNKKLRQNNLST